VAESVSTDVYLEARRRFIPWLPKDVLQVHAHETPLVDAPESAAVATRAVALGEPAIWVQAVRARLDDADAVDAASSAAELLSSEDRAQLAIAFAAAARIDLEGTLQVRTNVSVVLEDHDAEHARLDVREVDGEPYSVFTTRLSLDFDALSLGASFSLDLYEDSEGDWAAAVVRDTEENVLAQDDNPLPLVSLQAKLAVVAVLAELTASTPTGDEVWEPLLRAAVLPEQAAIGVVELFASRLEDRQIFVSEELVNALVNAEAYFSYPEAGIRTLDALMSVPTSLLRIQASSLPRAVTTVFEHAHLDSIPLSFRELFANSREELLKAGFTTLLLPELRELSPRPRMAAVENCILPLDPEAALATAIEEVRTGIDALESSDASQVTRITEEAERWLHLIDQIAASDPRLVRDSVGSIPWRSNAPMLAAGLLVLRQRVNSLPKKLSAEFVRTAGSASDEAAAAALAWAKKNAPLPRNSVEAALTAAACRFLRGGDDASHDREIASVMAANKSALPLADQLGLLAVNGSAAGAERVGRLVDVRDVQGHLFTSATRALHRRSELAKQRFRFAEAWKDAGGAARGKAVKGYSAAYKAVRKEADFVIVTESALRFFPTPASIPKVADLRRAGLAAAERLGTGISEEAQQVFQEAINGLRWNVSRTSKLVGRVMRRFGL
jgi:hypothetical protein